ncbi:chromosomal replication initiator DnaA [Mesobacterium sp. TK19101]|uniref:Chromosomal replication initiator DnaA n=1 Tax=Mesobacterium hydrothermale TaxID=3111907 RepID=A0ABU6HF84_9RHOB|nr:chromosomal replication initiator DnaA [Mesobacterium sp. TK19101]MEC3861031.1 chromosomal replication initiator DnaA [Mesobacterium sp. TK19101]
MTTQYGLDLPRRLALGREDFFVTEANALALALIDGWRNWAGGKLALVGPQGAGKTHLAHVWAKDSGARILPARDLALADIPALATGPVCVEDISDIAGQPEAENALFHLHNLVLAERHALMLTAHTPPTDWGIRLPDLASRMMGTQVARLGPPDDALLSAVLAKLFADRHSVPAPDVIPYLLRHMPRSFAAAGQVVAEIDRRALATRGGATRAKAREALAALELCEASGDN